MEGITDLKAKYSVSTGIHSPEVTRPEREVERCPPQGKGKCKAVPLQAWTGPEGSQEVKFPRFRDNGTGWR